VLRALDLFDEAGRADHLGLLDRLLEHPDGEVRRAALLRVSPTGDPRPLFERFLADPSPEVRATAIVGLLANDGPTHPRVGSILETIIAAGSSESKQALARAIGHSPRLRFDGILVLLANAGDPRVCREVALAMCAAPNPAHLESLLRMLEFRTSREEARAAMVAIGPPAFEFLERELADTSLPLRIRRQIPRTIARFEPQRAATVLLDHMLADEDGVTRYKTLRALGRLRTDHAEIELDDVKLDRAIERNLREAEHQRGWAMRLARVAPSGTKAFPLLQELLGEKQGNALERIFRLLQLKHPREDFQRMYRGLESGDLRARSSVRELLDHVVRSPTREALIAMIDPPAAGGIGRRGEPIETILEEILADESSSLQCLAGAVAGELGLERFAPRIEELRDRSTGSFAETFGRAAERIAQGAAR
jgi:HEAT repeat protein